ncbi:MAG: hypothetical protein ACQERB_16985 [Promethearchaeati archaeon]
MTKLSDLGLFLLVIGTLIVIFSFILSSMLSPVIFFYTLISGWTLFFLSIPLGLLTKNEYYVIKLKSGFPLNLDSLIVVICVLSLSIGSLVFVDILSYIYTGNFTYFSVAWCVFIFGGTFVLYYLKKRKSVQLTSLEKKIQDLETKITDLENK